MNAALRSPDAPRRDFRGFFPGVFTMGNLLCGFISVISVAEGEIITGCWFIILAAALDLLDGKVARIAGGESRFGIELDSLADFSSFGIAPAFLAYSVKLGSMGKMGWVVGVVYIMTASYRLARYNVMAQDEEKKYFLGLPVPAAALALVSFVLFSEEIWGSLQYLEYLVAIVIVSSGLMVSQVIYEAIPDRPRPGLLIFGFLCAAALIWQPKLVLFPLIAGFIMYGMVREAFRLSSKGVAKARSMSSRRNEEDGPRPE